MSAQRLQAAFDAARQRSTDSLALDNHVAWQCSCAQRHLKDVSQRLEALVRRPGGRHYDKKLRHATREYESAQKQLSLLRERQRMLHEEQEEAALACLEALDELCEYKAQHPEEFPEEACDSDAGSGEKSQDGSNQKSQSKPKQSSSSTSQANPDQDPHHSAKAYLAYASKALSNYSALTSFPEPPARPCSNAACQDRRALKACSCNIKTIFSHLGVKELKAWRHRFHPDRFSSVCVGEALKQEMQRKAQEVFVVVDELYQKLRD